MSKLSFLKEKMNNYDSNHFINELFLASKSLGILEEKINSYQFDNILIPLLNKKEAVSSMYIEGTQTTLSDVIEDEVNDENEKKNKKVFIETRNHTKALLYGISYLNQNNFTHSLIKELHLTMLSDIVNKSKENTLGKYKDKDNCIVNSAGTVVFNPPPYNETKKYMDELIDFMNDTKTNINPLIRTAIIHSQFESIHPFDDGNGRVGRLLITLCLYKYRVIKIPLFYISEAISKDKYTYYNKLTDSRKGDYTEWIKFFLRMCITQADKHIEYIDSLNRIYKKTAKEVKEIINSQKYEQILECIFKQPIITSSYLAETINVSLPQARKYLVSLENAHILEGNDRSRNRKFQFVSLIDLLTRSASTF